ncbi:UDP-N-acetylmuramoyl-L-alanine--D-glutamate ligase [Thermovenabulum sp.]|uniref:UDP-N-acetylmuramoyl-L-alanine--D-glutamate ligase n=1 Tax=Thermovenabulum sp. TaxID=3100335 RepID=UPI003C7A4511
MDVKDKKVLVVGLARSGTAACEELLKMGAKVTATDIKKEEELKEVIKKFEGKEIKFILGHHPLSLLDDVDFIVASPGVPLDIELFQKARGKNIPVISELELGYMFNKAPIIAVTGTNGKTTTTTLIGEILKNDGKNISVAGNIGIPFIQEADKKGIKDFLVLEVSSFQLENIISFRPHIAVILNITEDHLNYHKTFDNYIRAKARIFENQTEEDYLVLNYDDPIVFSLSKYAKSKIIYFSRKEELSQGVFVKNGVIVIKENQEILPILKAKEVGIKGSHNLENALASVAACWAARTNLNTMAESLRDFKGVEHRLEYVDTIDGVKFINDSKGTNPDAALKALEAIEDPIILIAGGYDKNADFKPFVKAFSGKVKKAILIGQTADKIEKAAREEGFYQIEKASTLKEAVEMAKNSASPGDTVLLSPACASWDMFLNFEERGKVFKEAVYSLRERV